MWQLGIQARVPSAAKQHGASGLGDVDQSAGTSRAARDCDQKLKRPQQLTNGHYGWAKATMQVRYATFFSRPPLANGRRFDIFMLHPKSHRRMPKLSHEVQAGLRV